MADRTPAQKTVEPDNTKTPASQVPGADIKTGLTSAEAAGLLKDNGPNALNEEKTGMMERLVRYFWGPIPWTIEIAATLSAALGDWVDFSIIMMMLLVNAGVDYWQENKAGSAIEALKKRLALTARMLRDGQRQDVPAKDLVLGDVARLHIGNVIPADMTLVDGDYLSAVESAPPPMSC